MPYYANYISVSIDTVPYISLVQLKNYIERRILKYRNYRLMA